MLIRSHAMNHPDDPRYRLPSPEVLPEGDDPLPWEGDLPPEEERGPDGRRIRHDAFTERRKHEFLRALVKAGTIEDAARAVGVNPRTIYRHQENDPLFFDHTRVALRMAATPIELTAWQRAVEGVEQEFACGGQIHVRRRYDAGLLRLLLQGSNPKKYGARPGFKRKRLYRHEKKQMEKEVRSEIASRQPTFDDAMFELENKLDALDKRLAPEKLAAGWTRAADGYWIPPGWAPIPGYQAPPPVVEGEGTPRETM
jgi:AcrR family transcriptional regulator